MPQLIEVPPGLKGVAAAETAIGDVHGDDGCYHYRQYDAIGLARQRTFEEVWCLLHDGELPGPARLADFTAQVAQARVLPPAVARALPAITALAPGDHSLRTLRAAYELTVLDRQLAPWLDLGEADLGRQAIATAAVFPTLVIALYRLAHGQQPIEPRPDLGQAASYLYMLEGRDPSPQRVRALESYLISTIDHGFNASTFTARVVASTGADLGSAVIAALGALSGPLHGGAPARVLGMLDEIGAPGRAGPWVRATWPAAGW